MRRLAVFLAALWWGGMVGVSFVAVPWLFATLGNPSVAGPVAAKLFSVQCWAVLGVGLALLLVLRRQRSLAVPTPGAGTGVDAQLGPDWQHGLGTMGFVMAAMLLALVQEFGVAHKILAARALGGGVAFWHSVGSAMVLGQWLCAGAVLWRVAK